jgi:protein-tyrosine phosphatase
LDIDLRYGEEFRIKTDSIALINSEEILCYSGTNYVLIEFTRTNVFSKLAQQAIEALQSTNKKILIAHPERYFDDVNEGIKTCKEWVNQGCFLQINRTSLLGVHGVYAEKMAHKLIKLGLAHVIATDAHESKGTRICRLDDIYFQIIKKYSQHQADMLFLINPTHLTKNEPMETVLKPKHRFVLIRKFKEKIKKPRHEKVLKKSDDPISVLDDLGALSTKAKEEPENSLAVKGE